MQDRFHGKAETKISREMTNFSTAERLPAIDLARGIALLGVALVNVHAFAAVWAGNYGLDLATGVADVVAEYVVAIGFSHRSYPVLAFLFGAGLAMQWNHLPDGNRYPRDLRPRLWALMVIGVAHGLLLWPGEVLTAYAIVGLIAVNLIDAKDRTRWVAATISYAIALAIYVGVGAAMLLSPEPATAPEHGFPSFAQSSFAAALLLHPLEFLTRGVVQVFGPDVWGALWLGMWAGRSGFLTRYLSAPNRYVAVMGVGALLFVGGSALEIFAATRGGWNAVTVGKTGIAWAAIAYVPTSLGAVWFWLTISAIWGRCVHGNQSIAPLILASGRAPLTQFIGQSIVFALLFNKSWVGLHGELGRGAYSLIAVATYLLLCAFIRAWLASGHRYGPMEILWRWLTQRFSPKRSAEPLQK